MKNERVRLAEIALKYGRTRGQFIRENAAQDADKQDLQSWSDAYSKAMRNAARRERHAAMTSMGLKRVKGALGGTYYE